MKRWYHRLRFNATQGTVAALAALLLGSLVVGISVSETLWAGAEQTVIAENTLTTIVEDANAFCATPPFPGASVCKSSVETIAKFTRKFKKVRVPRILGQVADVLKFFPAVVFALLVAVGAVTLPFKHEPYVLRLLISLGLLMVAGFLGGMVHFGDPNTLTAFIRDTFISAHSRREVPVDFFLRSESSRKVLYTTDIDNFDTDLRVGTIAEYGLISVETTGICTAAPQSSICEHATIKTQILSDLIIYLGYDPGTGIPILTSEGEPTGVRSQLFDALNMDKIDSICVSMRVFGILGLVIVFLLLTHHALEHLVEKGFDLSLLYAKKMKRKLSAHKI